MNGQVGGPTAARCPAAGRQYPHRPRSPAARERPPDQRWPRFAACYKIGMSVAMGYLLIVML